MATDEEKRSPVWLRILEISAGLIILILGIAAFYPGVNWALTTFIAFLAIALIIFEIVYIIRVFAKGMAGRRRFNLILSVLASLIAVLAIALSFYEPSYVPFYRFFFLPLIEPFYGFFFMPLIYLLALGLLFAGIASAVRGTVGGKIVGIFGIFVGIFVLIFLRIVGILAMGIIAIFTNLALLVAALLTLSLMIFGLEPIISGIMGRWM
jgi:hypothetical protein